MNNKIIINLYIPSLSKELEVIVPVNERISKIIDKLKKMIYDLSDSNFNLEKECNLMNAKTGQIYDYNSIIRETDIKHTTKLILM